MMTNFEKYYDEISKLYMCDYMVTSYGEVKHCGDIEANCSTDNCIFNRLGHCDIDRKRKWLFDEYEPLISYSEMIFANMFKDLVWFGRDKDGGLYLYCGKPTKGESGWSVSQLVPAYIEIDKSRFGFIRWEDEEPVRLSDIVSLYTGSDKDNIDDE